MIRCFLFFIAAGLWLASLPLEAEEYALKVKKIKLSKQNAVVLPEIELRSGGSKPELGTEYCLDRMQEMYQWDIGTRSGVIDFRGGELEVNEFPFDAVNEIIYNENDVVIRSIPKRSSILRTAASAPCICSASSRPMQPMRKLSATVSLPG